MAVQQNKPTRSKRGMRRSHDSLKLFNLLISVDSCSDELHRRHYLTPNGFYRGCKVFIKKNNNKNQKNIKKKKDE